jgi:hypothetical protein
MSARELASYIFYFDYQSESSISRPRNQSKPRTYKQN